MHGMKKKADTNRSITLQLTLTVICVGILALLIYLRVFQNKSVGAEGGSVANQYLITFYGFGFILLGALSGLSFINLRKEKGNRNLTFYRLILFGVGFFYFLYKLINSL